MSELSKHYDPTEVESRWYAWWLENGLFHSEPDADTEEAEVQRGLAAVAHALQVTQSAADDAVDVDEDVDKDEQTAEEARYDSERHGLVPVPVGEQPVETGEDEEDEKEAEDEDEFAEVE